ncbi:DNA repair protein RadA [Rickettsiales bacterium]|nr:DNA repair protein RadA [Rickettsiales bacterium]
MVKKKLTQYVCISCGNLASKWSGQCGACGEWNSLEEDRSSKASGSLLEVRSVDYDFDPELRIKTNYSEMDRVLGGGLISGSIALISGNPGVGKSTLLLQLLAGISKGSAQCLYVSGEESARQISIRARRLGIDAGSILLMSAAAIDDIIKTISAMQGKIGFLVIDSIQTMCTNQLGSAPGTIAQVRFCAAKLAEMAKELNITLILVGHINKDGQIAGPKTLEHMVDVVLTFEGNDQFRMLRSTKNRFGASNEIAVFEMRSDGLKEMHNPSELFLSEYSPSSGCVVFAGMEGTRPILVEIQALVAPSYMAIPRRAVVGWDSNRLAMIVAILNSRYGLSLGDKEIYLSVTGGIKIQEPAADLAVALALVSAVLDVVIPRNFVVLGELCLSGMVRAVPSIQSRLKEASKIGFKDAIIPKGAKNLEASGINTHRISHIKEIKNFI